MAEHAPHQAAASRAGATRATPAVTATGRPVARLDALQGRLNHAPAVAATAQLQRQANAAVAQRQPAGPPPNRTGLPDQLKSGIEALSGLSMDNVRVHYGSGKPAQLNAHAYAQGNEIHLAPGQDHHLPHEAWHVVQQAQGRVRPTRQLQPATGSGVAINDEFGLEREADAMGARAAAGLVQARALPLAGMAAHAGPVGAIQRVAKADVYRGGAELEYRQGQAQLQFGQLDAVQGVDETVLKGLIRSGIKGLPIHHIGVDRALTGLNWSVTVETNIGTALDNHGNIPVELELILGGATGSTLNELLPAADAAAHAITELAHAGTLHFGITGNTIRDNVRAKDSKKAQAQAVIDNIGYVPPVHDAPLMADWDGISITGSWDPQGPDPATREWGLQVTLGVPLGEVQLVGNALAGQQLDDPSVARPLPKAEPDLNWSGRDVLLAWQAELGGNVGQLGLGPAAQIASPQQRWDQVHPNLGFDGGNPQHVTELGQILEAFHTETAQDFRQRVEQAAQQVGAQHHAPSMATLNGLAKVLAAYVRGAGGAPDNGPKHSMMLVTKNPLPAVIRNATAGLPGAFYDSLRDACVTLVSDTVQGRLYRWPGHDLSAQTWATAMRNRNVDLIAVYDARYRSAQIGGLPALNDIAAADGAGPGAEAPVIEYRDLGAKRPDQMRGVFEAIIQQLG